MPGNGLGITQISLFDSPTLQNWWCYADFTAWEIEAWND